MPADGFKIRLATPRDLPSLARIDPAHDEPEEPRRRELLAAAISGDRCWIAALDGVDAGLMVLSEHWFGHRFIELVVVAAPARRRGVATALIRHAIATAPTPKVFTSTNESNLPMRGLLDRAGFVPSGTIHNLDPGDPELIFVHLPPQPTASR